MQGFCSQLTSEPSSLGDNFPCHGQDRNSQRVYMQVCRTARSTHRRARLLARVCFGRKLIHALLTILSYARLRLPPPCTIHASDKLNGDNRALRPPFLYLLSAGPPPRTRLSSVSAVLMLTRAMFVLALLVHTSSHKTPSCVHDDCSPLENEGRAAATRGEEPLNPPAGSGAGSRFPGRRTTHAAS